eukprot:6210406-Pleurochrysis_carterae.AAC.3
MGNTGCAKRAGLSAILLEFGAPGMRERATHQEREPEMSSATQASVLCDVGPREEKCSARAARGEDGASLRHPKRHARYQTTQKKCTMGSSGLSCKGRARNIDKSARVFATQDLSMRADWTGAE